MNTENTVELSELQQIRESRKAKRKDRKKLNRATIKRHCCNHCGEPKHYICLKHNTYLTKPNRIVSFYKKARRKVRTLYFGILRIINSFGSNF